jgi:hypothetical protein
MFLKIKVNERLLINIVAHKLHGSARWWTLYTMSMDDEKCYGQ